MKGETNMPVPLLDLKLQFKELKSEIMPVIESICDSQIFILGEHVKEFEASCAAYCGTEYACAVSSGSDALIISLMSEGIGAGDEIITSPFTFFATAGAISRVGAKPVFVDIDPASFTIDASKIEEAITPRTKAIIPVHLYGQTADMEKILQIAKKHSLIVIEDAAQAIGAECNVGRAASMGDYGCTSFFPSKNLGAFGDAGLVATRDKAKADMLAMMRNHGMNPKYYHKYVGGNFRMDALQAAILNIKLKYLDKWTAQRQENAAKYDSLFAEFPEIQVPILAPWCTRHVRNQYILRIGNGKRQQVWDALKANGIGCDVYYPVSLHQQECFADLGYKDGDFPESEKAALETIAIPIYPGLTDAQINEVASTVIKAII